MDYQCYNLWIIILEESFWIKNNETKWCARGYSKEQWKLRAILHQGMNHGFFKYFPMICEPL